MIEVLFSDSACGSLKAAQHCGPGTYLGGCTGVIISKSDGSKPTKAEIKAAQREAAEKERLACENAVPMEGSSADIFGFSLSLSIGDIAEENGIANRQRVLERLYSIYPNNEGREAAQKMIDTATKNLEAIHLRINAGEVVRIWYSIQPDEMCGLYWFLSQLKNLDINSLQIVTVKLPEWETEGKNIVRKSGWGEVSPEEWHPYLKLQQALPTALIKGHGYSWQTLQRENTSLRAVLNGQLVSAPETLYDDFILREIAAEQDEFREANVIGRVLGNYQLGIGDAWIALRFEKMIEDGKLKAISTADVDSPIYHRMLKKSE